MCTMAAHEVTNDPSVLAKLIIVGSAIISLSCSLCKFFSFEIAPCSSQVVSISPGIDPYQDFLSVS